MTSGRELLSVYLVIAFSNFASAQAPTPEQLQIPGEAQQAAVNSLDSYRQISGLTRNKFAAEAATVAPEVSPSSLGKPLHDYIIGLDPLKAWDGKDASKLLQPTNRLVYPINVTGRVQSSVTLANQNGKWAPVQFGSANEAQSSSLVLKTLMDEAPSGKPPSLFRVRVPALNATFIAEELGTNLTFTPITSVPNLELQAGKSQQANELLKQLQSKAKLLNSNVPN